MSMSLGLIITMGSVTVGGAIIEKVLGKLGKIEEAGMVGVVTETMLVTTVVTSIISAFANVRKLGK